MGLEMVLAKIVKTIVNFSSFWLKKRFYRDLGGIYVFLRIFQFCFKIRFCGGKRLLGKGNSTKID